MTGAFQCGKSSPIGGFKGLWASNPLTSLARTHELYDVPLRLDSVAAHGPIVVVQDLHLGHVPGANPDQDNGHGEVRVLHDQPLGFFHVCTGDREFSTAVFIGETVMQTMCTTVILARPNWFFNQVMGQT